jgi:hypothetical protein
MCIKPLKRGVLSVIIPELEEIHDAGWSRGSS